MNIAEVAKYLGVSHKSVRRYTKAGKLKVVYVNGKGAYNQREVEALKEEKQTPVHRAIVETGEQAVLSQLVLPDEIIRFLQVFERHHNLCISTAKLTLSLDEAAALSGFSRSGLREAVKSGTLKAIKQGGRWKVRIHDLTNYVNGTFDHNEQITLGSRNEATVR